MTLPFPVIDETLGETHTEPHPTKKNTLPLPEKFGRNLDTLEKARLWLINPHNWHGGSLFILKWDGLLCTIMKEKALQLINIPEDMGLPWCVMYGQKEQRAPRQGKKSARKQEESTENQESSPSGREQVDG